MFTVKGEQPEPNGQPERGVFAGGGWRFSGVEAADPPTPSSI
ncbi:hypothetical protein [Pyxidicoccus parkwayensis]|nr:hypothetical protein [Pyxidicoccus parkwaysis]